MSDSGFHETQKWYWVRRADGSLAPYRLHRCYEAEGRKLGEFYVGSLLLTWPLSVIEGPASMPEDE